MSLTSTLGAAGVCAAAVPLLLVRTPVRLRAAHAAMAIAMALMLLGHPMLSLGALAAGLALLAGGRLGTRTQVWGCALDHLAMGALVITMVGGNASSGADMDSMGGSPRHSVAIWLTAAWLALVAHRHRGLWLDRLVPVDASSERPRSAPALFAAGLVMPVSMLFAMPMS